MLSQELLEASGLFFGDICLKSAKFLSPIEGAQLLKAELEASLASLKITWKNNDLSKVYAKLEFVKASG